MSGSITARMVFQRSEAEMPVVVPSRTSIDTVKAVRRTPVLRHHHRQIELVEPLADDLEGR